MDDNQKVITQEDLDNHIQTIQNLLRQSEEHTAKTMKQHLDSVHWYVEDKLMRSEVQMKQHMMMAVDQNKIAINNITLDK